MDAAENRLKREFEQWLKSDPAALDVYTAGTLDGAWYWDLGEPAKGWMSAGFKALLGYSEDETLDTTDWWHRTSTPMICLN